MRTKKEKIKKEKKVHFKKIKQLILRIKETSVLQYGKIKSRISESIKLEIVTMVGICLLIAAIGGNVVFKMADRNNVGKYTYIEYEKQKKEIQGYLENKVELINKIGQYNLTNAIDYDQIHEAIDAESMSVYLYNSLNDVQVLYKNGQEERFSIQQEESREKGEDYLNSLNANNNTADGDSKYAVLQRKLNKDTISFSEKEAREVAKLIVEEREKAKEIIDMAMNIKRGEPIKVKLELIAKEVSNISGDTYVLDGTGNVVAKNGNEYITHIDIVDAINGPDIEENYQGTEVLKARNVYPIVIEKEIFYLLNERLVEGERLYGDSNIPIVLGFLVAIVIFIIALFKFIQPKLYYVQYVSHSLREIATGNLSYEVEVKGKDEIADVAKNINFMEQQLREQMAAQRQVEKTKSELITNVAHDLRTPLTSIIGYIGLLKDNKYQNEEEFNQYLDIAYVKSEKLKMLIEDLFEYTKLSNKGVKLHKETISITNLVNQLVQELMPLAEEKLIGIDTSSTAKNATVSVDSTKMTRAIENLLGNAIKYTKEGNRIKVEMSNEENNVIIKIKNKGKLSYEELDKLFDRFYRADASRNSTTGGSGLGLAIAKSIVEMHEGDIWASLEDEFISFNIRLRCKENNL